MKLAEWARQQGIHPKTAYRWHRYGMMPVPVRKLPSGTLLVEVLPTPSAKVVVLYARVSGGDQKADGARQLERLARFAQGAGMEVQEGVLEIGSGLNGKRPKLLRLLRDPLVTGIVVEHRDRLMRFGSAYLEAALTGAGKTLVVVEESEVNDDLVQDMVDVLTSFCARLYGRRSARRRAVQAIEAMAILTP